MNETTIKREKDNLRTSNEHFDKLLKICLILGIIIISGFIIYYVLTPEPGFVSLGILNSEKEAEDYPNNATVEQNISFYVTVENHMNRKFSFRIEILTGNKNTLVGSSCSINATSYYNTTKITLLDKEFWISNMLNVSFSLPGEDKRIFIELWQISSSGIEKCFSLVFLWLNILP